jgi:hypothetical protein
MSFGGGDCGQQVCVFFIGLALGLVGTRLVGEVGRIRRGFCLPPLLCGSAPAGHPRKSCWCNRDITTIICVLDHPEPPSLA